MGADIIERGDFGVGPNARISLNKTSRKSTAMVM